MIAARCVLGAAVMFAGFWMVAVLAPPDPNGWGVASIALMGIGAAISAVAALDLMDERR